MSLAFQEAHELAKTKDAELFIQVKNRSHCTRECQVGTAKKYLRLARGRMKTSLYKDKINELLKDVTR